MTEAWAAIVAGVIAAAAGGIGLVMAKENKTSEFRQAWIQDLRTSLTELSSISLTVRNLVGNKLLISNADRQKVNMLRSEINLRINFLKQSNEEKALSAAIQKMLVEAFKGSANFNNAQADFTEASFRVLKKEWKRVKNGEFIYRFCMYPCLAISALAVVSAVIYASHHFDSIWHFLTS